MVIPKGLLQRLLEYWSVGVMEEWGTGVLEYWSDGGMGYWSIGVLETTEFEIWNYGSFH